MKNAFYSILKALFALKMLVLMFWSCRKNSLIRNMKLISKFMTSIPEQQIVIIHILSDISRSNTKQTRKFGQVIEHDKRNIFLQQSWKKYCRETRTPELFLFFKKDLSELKARDLQPNFNILRQSSTWDTIKANSMKLQTIDPEICSILIFKFF